MHRLCLGVKRSHETQHIQEINDGKKDFNLTAQALQ